MATTGATFTFSNISTYVVRKLWTLIAIVLVVFALLISLLRYSLPFLNDYKDSVEQYIAKTYAIELHIGELSASWQTNGPALILRDVTIEQDNQSPVNIALGEVFFEIDFWPSITELELRSNQVELRNLDLSVDLTRIQANESELPLLNAIETIFLEQLSNFNVYESTLTVVSTQNELNIDIQMLSWLNRDNRHQGVGEFALADINASKASFVLDLYGDAESYSGMLFAQTQDVNLSPWINEFTGLDNQLKASQGNLEIWANINNGQINRVDGKLLPTTFEWTTDEASLHNEIKANFAAQRLGERWHFSLADFTIDTQNSLFSGDFNGYVEGNSGLVIRSSDSYSLNGLLPLTDLISPNLSQHLAAAKFNAKLEAMDIYIDQQGITASVDFASLGWNEQLNIPGLRNLDAKLLWHHDKGKITLTSEQTAVQSAHYFGRDLLVSALNLPIQIDLSAQQSFSIKRGIVKLDDIPIRIDSDYALESNFLSLAAYIGAFEIDKVATLLPNHLLSDGTRRFLSRAFIETGEVSATTVLWHGHTGRFPFDDLSGVFQTQVEVSQADFSFSSGWPLLTELDIELMFENKALSMRSPQSMIDKVKLTDLYANIPSLDQNALLTISAKGQATSSQVTDLMLKSSLSDSLGRVLADDVLIDGELSTSLDLFIPLNDATNTRAVGKAFLDNNNIRIPSINLTLSQAQGAVEFDNDAISINALSASVMQQDVTVNLVGELKDTAYLLDVNVAGNWDVNPLTSLVNDEFAALITGNTFWQIDADIAFLPDNFNYKAVLSSNLNGVYANLPAPLYKESAQNMPLNVTAIGNNIASSIELNLANVAVFDGALPHKEKRFNRAHLALGPTELESRGLGFSISGDFEVMEFEKWYPLIKSLSAAGSRPSDLIDKPNIQAPIISVPQRIFIDTEQLYVQGQLFNDVDVTIKRLDNQWTFDVDANEVRGNIALHDDWFSRGLVIDAEYMRIPKSDSPLLAKIPADLSNNTATPTLAETVDISIDPKNLPSINFTCKSCDVSGLALGRVELEAQPNNDGLEITQLLVNNEHGSVNSSGQWYKRNQDHYTFLAGVLDSQDFGAFLQQLGFDSGITDSSANIDFALKWQDGPFDMKYEQLDGELNWRLSDGYLTEVSDKGSRIFTLLSLNSLVRKLSLDFRDVFAKGFFYDKMQGSVQITDGKADTRDTNIDGAAGEIEIYGYTDLANQALNYNVSFTPNVTGNLPVLVYFFTVSPPSALAALAIDQMLTSAKVISNVNYSVTGTIKEPILIETGRESTEVDLPARRKPEVNEQAPLFIPPTKDDLIEIEVKDGQSG